MRSMNIEELSSVYQKFLVSYRMKELLLSYNRTISLENRKQRAILISEYSSSTSIGVSGSRGFFLQTQDNQFGIK